jgi:hypothetical protein
MERPLQPCARMLSTRSAGCGGGINICASAGLDMSAIQTLGISLQTALTLS